MKVNARPERLRSPAYILGEVMLRAKTEDRGSSWIKARAVTVPGEHEVILSDFLVEKMEIFRGK
jgi:hypothetical protein